MKRKGKESKLNVALTSILVLFICLLSFSIGVITGKGWSDREYKVRYIQKDDHVKSAEQDTEPLGDEMTQKEVKLLTDRALKEAEAQEPKMPINKPEETSALDQMEMEAETETQPRKVASAKDGDEKKEAEENATKVERKVSSVMPKPSTPKPKAIDYTVQVAAYKTIEDAERHSQKLIDKGFPAFPVKAMIKGSLWYRVAIGSFKTKKQAKKYEMELKKQAVVKNTFVQKIERLKK